MNRPESLHSCRCSISGSFTKTSERGVFEYRDNRSERYRGKWVLDKAWRCGRLYEGHWNNGAPHGFGKCRDPRGEYRKAEGPGFVQHTNGVEGCFAKNKTDGMRHLREGKRIYQGAWKNGKRHGNEESTHDDDDNHWVVVYEGEYRRGQRHGHGKLVYANGSSYEGLFVEGRMEGYGKRVCRNGTVQYEGRIANATARALRVLDMYIPTTDIATESLSKTNVTGLGDALPKTALFCMPVNG